MRPSCHFSPLVLRVWKERKWTRNNPKVFSQFQLFSTILYPLRAMLGPNITSADFSGLECSPHYLEKRGSTIVSETPAAETRQSLSSNPTSCSSQATTIPAVTLRKPSVSQQLISGNYPSLFLLAHASLLLL